MYISCVTKSLLALGISDIDTDYDNYLHHTDSYALRYNYERNFSKGFSKQLLEDFETDLLFQMSKYDAVKEIVGASTLVDFLRKNKIAFCFATGALPKTSALKLEQCNIWYDTQLLATSKTHESREGFVLDAIDRAKSFYNQQHFEEIISIGDGVWDLKTAQNLSLNFVGIGDRNKSKLISQGTKHWFKNLEAFKQEYF